MLNNYQINRLNQDVNNIAGKYEYNMFPAKGEYQFCDFPTKTVQQFDAAATDESQIGNLGLWKGFTRSRYNSIFGTQNLDIMTKHNMAFFLFKVLLAHR